MDFNILSACGRWRLIAQDFFRCPNRPGPIADPLRGFERDASEVGDDVVDYLELLTHSFKLSKSGRHTVNKCFQAEICVGLEPVERARDAEERVDASEASIQVLLPIRPAVDPENFW